ncbi:MAG: hypothetical protein ACXQTM_06595 [Methanosarcinales archaeon]
MNHFFFHSVYQIVFFLVDQIFQEFRYRINPSLDKPQESLPTLGCDPCRTYPLNINTTSTDYNKA